jgi:hypothetical protein
MKKLLLIILTCIFCHSWMMAEKITAFKDDFQRPAVLLDDKYVYIYDTGLLKVCVYTRKDFVKIAEFGRRGAGPQEYIYINNVSLSPDYLMISSFPKICLYHRDGKFYKEVKSSGGNTGGYILFGDRLVGQYYQPVSKPWENGKTTFSLFNFDLEKEKDLITFEIRPIVIWEGPKRKIHRFPGYTKAVVYKDKIFAGSPDKGFYIAVFDKNGNRVNEIVGKYDKRKVTKEDRDYDLEITKKLKGETGWKKFSSQAEFIYPDYFPAYKNFEVSNDKIYVFPFPVKDKAEVIILDTKGNLLKQKPLKILEPEILETRDFTIFNGKIYYVYDNDDMGQWELHGESIE